MNTQQKLTDILALVTYIKEHINVKPHEQYSEQLDTIGATALSMLKVLEGLDVTLTANTTEIFVTYKGLVDEMSTNMLEQLTTVSDSLVLRNEITANTLNGLGELQTKCIEALTESKILLQNHQVEQGRNIQAVKTGIDNLLVLLQTVDSKVVTKIDLEGFVDMVNTTIKGISENDAEVIAQCETHLSEIKKMKTAVMDGFASLGESIQSVDDSFKTSVSRLDVILMKVEAFMGGDNND